jgi:Tol biopolymer transport system component
MPSFNEHLTGGITVSTMRNVVVSCGLMATLAMPFAAQGAKIKFSEAAPAHAFNPTWSVGQNAGKYIAWESNRMAGDTELWFVEMTGDVPKTPARVALPGSSSASSSFSAGGRIAANPAWHPQVMVFEGSSSGGSLRLYYYPPGGGAAAEMITSSALPGNLTFPQVASDGSALAFVSSATGAGDIYVRTTANGQLKQITDTEGTESYPSWSRDNKKMLFTRKKSDTEAVYELDLATGTERQIASGTGDQTRPVYASGGRVVYFTSERGKDLWDVAVVDADGSNKKILARDIRLPLRSRPALDPAGEWLAFASNEPAKDGSIGVVKVDGSTAANIPTGFKACGEPALSRRDGKALLAFTALPPDNADWRFLYVMDVTGKF